jgi:hypothetical protein
VILFAVAAWGGAMRGQAGFFDIDERLKELSAKGDSARAAEWDRPF